MVPTPEENIPPQGAEPLHEDGNRVVISGMSGLFANTNNVKEFEDMLYNKVNPLTKEGLRYDYNHPEVVQYGAGISNLNYFDANFFKVRYHLAQIMDPMGKKMLEQTFQAIYDAGIHLEELAGKKVGVYSGTCYSESEHGCLYEVHVSSSLGVPGCSRSMLANRVSYWLDAKGPSLALDQLCSSSLCALEQAYLSVSRGECEAAIVCGAFINLHPILSLHYNRAIQMSKDGKTKSFDEHGSGCVLSEAVSVMFLQKAKYANRVYAEVVHAKCEFTGLMKEETGPKYGFQRDQESMTKFLRNFYKETKISPQNIEYVEAFGCAIPEVDKMELDSIAEVFCKKKENPLLIGSVMSNIGYSEAASGLSAITKVLLGYHNGEIAANLHCDTPRKDIEALRTGCMEVVTKTQHFDRTYAAVNGLSITGINSHILLHGNYKPKDLSRYMTDLPYLVNVSGRHEESVEYMHGILKSNPVDPEQLALLHNIHQKNISGHMGRGYIILESDKNQRTVSLREKAAYFNDTRRPLWFVYSGMGSQWVGMGVQLMRIPIFAAAVERCRKILEPKGLDLVNIITSDNEGTFDNILHSFVGIAVIQIGLTDVLHEIGLKPDGIIGHSVGELGCAYADGCLTAEEMILSAYYRGLVSIQTKFIHGSMAAVGMGYEEVVKLCPPEIEVACHNGPGSSTISGPSDIMQEFVSTMTGKGIFAKEVPCSNIAYHSRYIADAGPHLLNHLKNVIKHPKSRSERWLSTSVPINKWKEPIAQLCSAEYLTNNLLSSVLFDETSQLIPKNAVLVEVAPHALLQAILKRSVDTWLNVPLTRRKHPNNVLLLLQAIGELYLEGFESKVQMLYPKVEMPVSTGTPFLSHLVKWVHDEQWPVAHYQARDTKNAANCNFILALHDKEHNYLRGHSLRGYTTYPLAASLTLVWDVLAMTSNVPKKQMSVEFTNLKFYSEPVLHNHRQLILNVSIHRATGYFEILNDISKVVTGFINPMIESDINYDIDDQIKTMYFSSSDVYQMFRDRDYFYSEEFQSIVCADESLSDAELEWNNNWTTFIDGMLQLNALRQPHNSVSQPCNIRRVTINVEEQIRLIKNLKSTDDQTLMIVKVSDKYQRTRCGGVLLENIKFQHLPPYNGTEMALKSVQNGEEYCLTINQNTISNQHLKLEIAEIGDYNSLEWVNVSEFNDTTAVIVNVHYAGINTNDIEQANGELLKINRHNTYGLDFSGITTSDIPVMGISPLGSASTQLKVQPELLWPVPAHWTLQDAATVPFAYMLAFYILGIKTQLTKKKSIFVHGGAGALGQAIISIALAFDCEVFTTVRDIRKKQFLMKLFPGLKEDHISCSRDYTFGYNFQEAFKERRCNIAISCVNNTILKEETKKCVAIEGLFIDLTQLQKDDDYNFEMYFFMEPKNYKTIDFSSLFEPEHVEELIAVHKMVSDGIVHGYVRPLTRATFAMNEAPRAFRLLASSSHYGRVLINMKKENIQTHYRLNCSADRSNLILCGNTTFGVHLADRLVARGAKQLYLHVQSLSAYLENKIRSWRQIGVRVNISSEVLNDKKGVDSLIHSALKLGPLEGVYVAAEETMKDDNLIRHLDAAIRNLPLQLRYYAMIYFGDNSSGKNILLSRIAEHLPTTVLTLPDIQEVAYRESIYWRSVIDATEQSLQHTGVILARIEKQRPSILKQIAKIAELNIPDSVDNTLTLQDLGIKYTKLRVLKTYLSLQYNLTFEEEDIQLFTINMILKLVKEPLDVQTKNINGLSTFFNYVDSDELLATTEIVFLPTLFSSSFTSDNLKELNETKLCIIPGMEGNHHRFRLLCERLKLPAIVLQPGLDHLNESVEETAQRMIEVMLKKTALKDKFYLMGYESGVAIALEMAALLEDRGLIGKVFCIGGTSEELKTELEVQLLQYEDEKQLKDGVLRHMYLLMDRNGTIELDIALKNVKTWSEKLEVCIRTLLSRVPHSAQYARSHIENALKRIQQIRKNNIALRPIHSQIILLHAKMSQSPVEDTGLQHLSQSPPIVYQLDTSLFDIVGDLRCATIINEHLDHEILENFASKNICTTYLLNENSFIFK